MQSGQVPQVQIQSGQWTAEATISAVEAERVSSKIACVAKGTKFMYLGTRILEHFMDMDVHMNPLPP